MYHVRIYSGSPVIIQIEEGEERPVYGQFNYMTIQRAEVLCGQLNSGSMTLKELEG